MIVTETAKKLVAAIRGAVDDTTAIETAQHYLNEAFEAGVSEILTTDPPKDGRPE